MDYYEFLRICSLAVRAEGYVLDLGLTGGKTRVAFAIRSKEGALLYVAEPYQLRVKKMEMQSFGNEEGRAAHDFAKGCVAAARLKESVPEADPAP
jgi:hypothetical protein